jgi:hypothetical protein
MGNNRIKEKMIYGILEILHSSEYHHVWDDLLEKNLG